MFAFLAPFVVFVGFYIGVILANTSPEEMESGKKYFVWMMHLVSLGIIITLFYFGGFHLFALIAGLVFGYFVRRYYFAFGFAIAGAMGLADKTLFLLCALIFLFGIPYGTRMRASKKFTNRNVAISTIFFFLPFLVLFTTADSRITLVFAAGALIATTNVKSFPLRKLFPK